MRGLYRPGHSPLHRLPAGPKLLALVVAGALVIWLDTPTLVGAALLLVALGYPVAGFGVRVWWEQVAPVLWVLVPLGLLQAWWDGPERAVVVVGTILALVMLAALVTLTTRTTALVDVVVRVAGPLRRFGVDPERVGLMLALGVRAVPVVAELAREVREAQLARGLGASPRAFAVPLVIRSLRHADRLGDALAARGLDD